MATDIEQQLERYFGWLEVQASTPLHRDAEAGSNLERPIRRADEVAEIVALERQFGEPAARPGVVRPLLVLASLALIVALVAAALVAARASRAPSVPSDVSIVGPGPTSVTVLSVPSETVAPTITTEGTVAAVGATPPASGNWYARFTPDGEHVMAVVFDQSAAFAVARTVDVERGAPLLATSDSGVAPFSDSCGGEAVSDDGRLFWDGESVRSLSTLEVVFTPPLGGPTRSADISPDGSQVVVTAGRKSYAVYSMATGEQVAAIATDDYSVMCPQFFPDGNRLFLPGLMPSARVYDLAAGVEVLAFPINDGLARLSPDGRFAVIDDGDRAHRLVDARSGDEVLATDGQMQAFSLDGSRAVEVHDAGGVTVWDLDRMIRLADIAVPRMLPILDVNFSPDGTHLVLASEGAARIHDTRTGEVLSTIELDEGRVLAATYSPDGTKIVTANSTGTVTIWPVP